MNLDLGVVGLLVAAVAAGAFVKGITGMGLPQVAIPVLATWLGVEAAVVIMAIPGIVTNTWMLWNYRNYFGATRDLPTLLLAGTAGAIAGTLLLETANEDALALVLAAVIILYVILFFANPELRLPPKLTRYASSPVGLAAGALQGATGMSGPIISTYLHGFRLSKEAYVLSITTMFQVYALVQAVTLAGVGLYTADRLALSLLSLIPIMGLLSVGARFARRVSPRTFEFVVLGLLVASALKLAYDALT